MEEEIVVESNNLIRSVQVILDALNELRLCHVMERATSVPSKYESSKVYADATYNIFSMSLKWWSMTMQLSSSSNTNGVFLNIVFPVCQAQDTVVGL